MHPFVKWAGGKTQIITRLKELMPTYYNDYYEPFVGGGALLFAISPKTAFINDQNSELMCAYKCFTDEALFHDLKQELKKHEKNNSEKYYYEVRKQDQGGDFYNKSIPIRAARMIYLNKACFNGLYRVNSKGFFNVPFGKKETIKTFDEDNFSELRKFFLSSDIIITNQDYQKCVETAQRNDFVYFDPPYDTYPNHAGFINYGKTHFGRDEQLRLSDCFKILDGKNVKVMLSNHNTPLINNLYKGFNIHVVNARRMINSNGDGRGNVQEVIITNY